MVATPYKKSSLDKKAQVTLMFNNIAGRYDFLNHFLSFGIDHWWRRRAVARLQHLPSPAVLDVATGTADLALAALRLNPTEVVCIDISEHMLAVGRQKVARKKAGPHITLQLADSEAMPFDNNRFHAITCGFGVRNFAHLNKGLREMYRVMKPGGRLAILEFAQPRIFPVKQIYRLYFRHFLPLWGRMISRDRSAYTYLPHSVAEFPSGNHFLQHLKMAGFKNPSYRALSLGIVHLYVADK